MVFVRDGEDLARQVFFKESKMGDAYPATTPTC